MPERRMIDVFMVTYNHENYIAQAVESVLMQETEYDFQLIIAEDCSTDGTGEIVRQYQQQYPDKIKLLHSEHNMGAQRNFANILACKAKYVAILDGDDYWTSPHKLQQQVDFLEHNTDYVICFHQVEVLWDDGSGKRKRLPQFGGDKKVSIHDLFNDFFMPTSSIVYRNGHVTKFPNWFYSLPMGDRPLNIMNAHFGKIKYIDQSMGVYRIHPNGIWSMTREANKENLLEQKIRMLVEFDAYFGGQYRASIADSLATYKLVLSAHRLKSKRIDHVFTKLRDERESWLDELAGKDLIIFGTGEFAQDVYRILHWQRVPVKLFVDNDPAKSGETLFNVPITNTEILSERFAEDHLILIASMYYSEIRMQLEEMGLEFGRHFMKVNHFFGPNL